MAERKDRMALLSRYSKLHTQKFEQKPVLNLNIEQWAADALIESYGLPECYNLLDYYFEIINYNLLMMKYYYYYHIIIDVY